MSLSKFFRLQNRPARRRPTHTRLQVERLECRAVPSANIDVSHTSTREVEADIDLNPVNSQNLVASAINPRGDAAYFSRDGGQTWSASSPLPISFQGTTRNASSDPTVAFDSRGNVYVAGVAAEVDFSTFTITDEAVFVAKSTDGGQSFTQSTAPAVSTNPGLPYDHPKVAVDHSQISPFRDTVYVTWISEPSKQLVFSRSTDGGLTWSAPLTLDSAGNKVQLNTQTVGPDGTLYVSYVQDDPAGHSTQFVACSTDGGVSFSSRITVTTLNGLPAFTGEAFPSPAQPNRFHGVSAITAQASLDVDRSAGPFRGRVYMAFVDRPDPDVRPFDEDVYLQFSDDHGQTWSPRQRINDDGLGNSQFFPSLSVDPTNGKVLISWYDTRRDPNIQKTDIFLAVGNPSRHGVQFRPNLRVTDQQSDESVNNPQAVGWYGDYEGLVAYGGVAHPVWVDARADNFAAGLREEVYTTAFQYVDDDAGEDAGSGSGTEFAAIGQGSSGIPTSATSSRGRQVVPSMVSASGNSKQYQPSAAPPRDPQTFIERHAKPRPLAELLEDWDEWRSPLGN